MTVSELITYLNNRTVFGPDDPVFIITTEGCGNVKEPLDHIETASGHVFLGSTSLMRATDADINVDNRL